MSACACCRCCGRVSGSMPSPASRGVAPSCARPARCRWWPTWTSRQACAAWPAWRAISFTWRRHSLTARWTAARAPCAPFYPSGRGSFMSAPPGSTATAAPRNARALRRVDAERTLRRWAGNAGASVSILRVPGIYGVDRLPLKRLREGTPALIEADDVYTNHIHADDLAAAIVRALWRGLPGRVYHAVDDSDMKMAAYFDAVADAFQLPRPPRLPRAELARVVTPALLSFMSESRRLRNDRLTGELGLRLRYPTVAATLAACVKMVD